MFRQLVRALPALTLILAPVVGQTTAEKPFTLEEAIALALKKNFDLQVQAFSVENAKDTIAIQEAAFDPTINANTRRNLSQSASTTSR